MRPDGILALAKGTGGGDGLIVASGSGVLAFRCNRCLSRGCEKTLWLPELDVLPATDGPMAEIRSSTKD